MPNQQRDFFTRFLEILPGVSTWTTLIGAPILSYFHPAWISVYIIAFDLYWFLKGANVAAHLLHSNSVLKYHQRIDWLKGCQQLSNLDSLKNDLRHKISIEKIRGFRKLYSEQLQRLEQIKDNRNLDWTRVYHLIVLPTYKEPLNVLESSIQSYLDADYPANKIIMAVGTEERGGEGAIKNAAILKEKYGQLFYKFLSVIHPDGIPGEAKVKGANATYMARQAQRFLDEQQIPYEDVIISNFDSDTMVAKNYFAHLTYDFLTIDKPHQASYQPMPMFHNNIWDTPAIARVIATSSSFWQLVEASRPDRLVTFSSHSMSFKTLVDVGFWRVDIIPEDSHIFWQCFTHYNGDYRSHPLFSVVSMDAVLGESYIGTLVAQYKQKRRWAWGVTEISMVVPEFIRNKKIPLWKRLLWTERLFEGHYFWATASIMLALLGWLPLIFGGDRFGDSVLAANLPFMTRTIMTTATGFLIFSMYVNMVLLTPRPAHYGKWKSATMILQWLLTPIVSSIFGSFPAIDAQTRLMFGRYMEFWVTPKIRKDKLETNSGLQGEAVKLK
ncbi:MAG: glycosyltransferase family 2 protein [Candidatus Doudnabacteria bacterium]|nr:glycosyltransferase family 2 protein [Candidatus Doudnabacteria bacterium]